MKRILAIILAVAMVMSMAVVASAADAKLHTAEINSAEQQNATISATISSSTCSTVTVIITGTVELTDGAESGSFRVYPNKLGTTGSGASDRGDNIEVTADNLTVDYCAEFPLVTDCNGLFAKNFTNLAAADLDVIIYEGTIEEYEASLLPEAPAGDVVIGGVGYDEEVLYTSTSLVDASIEGWGWYNAFEQGTFGSYDAALAALNGTYIKVTHVGSINAPFWQTTDSPNNKTTVFGTTNGVTYFNSSVLYDDMVALGDQGWGNVVIAGNGDEAETVSKVEIVTLVEVPAADEEVEETYRGAGYFMTGDETHAIIIGKAIITSNHVFDADGDCKYCGHHVDVEVDDIIVIQPTESTEEESEDITVTEPKEDTNPGTGLTLAVIPAIVALAAVVISKR